MELDRILHQPVRTQIVSYLSSHGATDYVTLRNALELSDGHMTTHMRELLGGDYVTAEKEFVDNKKPRTTYKLTTHGRKQFSAYLKTLREIIAANER